MAKCRIIGRGGDFFVGNVKRIYERAPHGESHAVLFLYDGNFAFTIPILIILTQVYMQQKTF